MPVNLTNSAINATYSQLLHVDGGPEATEKVVHSGTGVASALRVGTQSASVGNLRVSGNTFSATNTNGNINFTPNGTGAVVIPKVTFSEVTQARTALGLGSMATQNSNAVAITGGTVTNVVFTGSFVGITLIESDKFSTKNSSNGVSLESNNIFAEGTSTDLNLNIAAKGTGSVNFSHKFGYAAGTGGSVTQLTNKSTAVTLNKLSGRITMSNAQLNRVTGVSFTLNNTFVDTTDVVVISIAGNATPTAYTVGVTSISAGACSIHLHNLLTNVDLSEAVQINFVIIKGAHT